MTDPYDKPGWHLAHTFPDGEWVVSTTMWRNKVIVVTSEGVYLMRPDPVMRFQLTKLDLPWDW